MEHRLPLALKRMCKNVTTIYEPSSDALSGPGEELRKNVTEEGKEQLTAKSEGGTTISVISDK